MLVTDLSHFLDLSEDTPGPGSPACGACPQRMYWRDRNLRFHLYGRLAPSNRIDDLLSEIDRDPTCIFWG